MPNNRKPTRQKIERMLFLASSVILGTLLTGCATGPSRYICPTLKTYPSAFQTQAALEFAKSGKNIQQLVSDYGQLRDACRALEGK